jgi:hypothetical protein
MIVLGVNDDIYTRYKSYITMMTSKDYNNLFNFVLSSLLISTT